jgi:chromosome segregation protein
MYIKKIELQGFKSFYKKTKIEFHSGVTAIVGPNGCGKSNLVDAIIWSLGEGRLRTLKGERVGEIIFSGSQKREPSGMAEVVLWIEDKEWDEPLSVGRIIYRSGESEFRINGKKVRLKDVQDELWKRGLGGKDYFVIEQGNIGAIITYKPNEKRTLIEEAAGIIKYKERKRESKLKLEDAKQNLIRIEDILQETEKQKNSLQRQASLSRKYKNLRERLRDLSILYFYLKSKELFSQFEEINLKISDSEFKEKKIKDRISQIEEKIRGKRDEFSIVEREIREVRNELLTRKTELEKEKANLEKEEKRKTLLIKSIEESEREIGRIEKELEEWEAQETTALEEIENNRNGKENSLKKINEIERILAEEIKNYDEASKVQSDFEKELSKFVETDLKYSNQIKVLEGEITSIGKYKDRLKSELLRYREIFEMKWKEDEYKTLKDVLNSLKKEIEVGSERINETNSKIKELEKEIHSLEIKDKEINARLEILFEKEKEDKIDGVYGRLKDFLKVEKKYIKGAEKLWEKELSSFVVKDKDKILSMIKDGKLKGEFLFPIEKELKKIELESVNPEIEIEENISLPPIAMVENIEKAFELLEKLPTTNFITEEGFSLTSYGLLTIPSEEGVLSLKEEIKSLKNESEIIKFELSNKRNLLESLRKEIIKINNEMRSKEIDFKKITKNINDLEIEKSLIEKEKGIAQENIEKIELELQNLEREEKKIEEELEKLRAQLKENKENIDTLKNKLKPLQEELKRKENNISKLKEEITYEKGMFTLFEGREKDIKKNLENMKMRKETLSAKLLELKEKIKIEKKEVEEISLIAGKVSETLKNKELEISKIEFTIKEKESVQIKLREEIENLENEFRAIKKSMDEEKEKRNSYEIKKAEIKRDLLHIEERVWNEASLTLKELEEKVIRKEGNVEEIEDEIEKLKKEVERFGPVNLLAEQELEEVKKRINFLKSQRDDVKNSIESIQKAIEKIDEESRSLFMQAFEEINENFKKTFSMLFEGGDSELRLQDMENPLESGVDIYAQPPGKKLLNLNLLSGGEKALTSLAFLFALFLFKPSPFCVFDEVDAPLDDANLGRFLKFIDDMKPYTQFIIITHNPKTIEKADYIYGITMNEPGISSVYSMKLEINNKPEEKREEG